MDGQQKKELSTAEYINQYLDYNPETGIISWKIDHGNCKKNQAVYVAKRNGYLNICIKGKKFRVHRIAFLIMTGEWPKLHIDHINGDKADNRFCNLREVTIAQNSQNSKFRTTNTSGFKGVAWHKAARKWQAYICANRKLYHLGLFEKIEDAANAYKQASEKLHKEFASHKGCMQNTC